jgi:hypothetical protein
LGDENWDLLGLFFCPDLEHDATFSTTYRAAIASHMAVNGNTVAQAVAQI